ncbi:hypothetical protein, partial [Candidatus Raskinella chloraquaticus]|uniref:hypothetical protein n=1 Tax=Candidatus Raskinella chloraquaticus TaxID=1951219 RepID=UPI0036701780
MNGAGPNVFSIPPGKRFLATLVNALLNGRLIAGFPDPADPLSLARATLLLPTRRACRAVLDCFLDIGGAGALLAPPPPPRGGGGVGGGGGAGGADPL